LPSILFVNRVLDPEAGATGRLLHDLAGAMAAAGWRVTVVACGPAEPPPGVAYRPAAPRLDGGRLGRAAALLRLATAALAAPRHDVVVTMTDPPLLGLLGPLLRRRGTALLHWCQDLYPALFPALGLDLPPPLLRALERLAALALNRHDAVLAIGRCMAERLAGQGVERVSVLPNWPDPAIAPLPRRAGGPFTVLYSGTLGLAHPMAALLDAAERLRDEPDIRFVIAGAGSRRAELAAAVAARGLSRVALRPAAPRGALSAHLAAADLLVATMAPAALGGLVPSKVAGALAAGRPCLLLGPAAGEAATLIRRHGAGAVLPADDGAALAAEIRRLRDDPAALEAACAAALRAVADLTLDGAASRFAALAAAALAARRRPAIQPEAPLA